MKTMRPLTVRDISHRLLEGYYIRLMAEYSPLNLRRCIKLRAWNESGGLSLDDGVQQALAFFNHEVERMAKHIDSLRA